MWQRIQAKVRTPAPVAAPFITTMTTTPAPTAAVLVPNACLGAVPSAPAQSYLLSYYQRLIHSPLVQARVRVVDPDKKFYCTLLQQYWDEWTMAVPKDKVPTQFQALAPSQYRYVSPLAQCVGRSRAQWCDDFVARWQTEPNYGLDAAAVLAIYAPSCGRGDCPFVDSSDRVQADYYLLGLLEQKLFGKIR